MKNLFAAMLLLVASFASAQPTTLVLPVSAGGFVHRLANELMPGLSFAAESTVVPDFRPGAAGQVGARFMSEKTGDEMLIMIGAAQRWKDTNLSQLHDLKPIAFLGTSPGLIIAKPNRGFTNYKQFADYAKKNKASYGIVASSANVQLFKDLHSTYDIPVLEVPYKTGSQITADVVGGHVDVGMTVADAVIPLIEDGKLVPLAVFSRHRSNLLPNVPTLIELGLGTKNESKYYNNIFVWVNKSADPVKVERFKTRLLQYLQSEDGLAALKKMDMPLGGRSHQAAEKTLKSIIED